MGFQLAPSAIEAGFRLESFPSVGSTNTIAIERAQRGERGPLWIASSRQEEGRGRRGRPWATPEGNLASTLLLTGLRDLKVAATLGFVAGLALGDALDRLVPDGTVAIGLDGVDSAARRGFELKWPNDVLAGGAKLAGILLESTILGDAGVAVAIGIGVNVAVHPTDVPYPATSLARLGHDCGAEALFLALSDRWIENWRIWDEGRGLRAVRDRWLARAAGLGSEVAVKMGNEVLRGTFETIDEDCRIVIRDGQGRAFGVAAGDVHFGAVASMAAV